MTPEEHWTEHAPRPRRPRLGPLLHRVAAELPHISEAKGMRMEGGTRLAFLSFYGVQNARTLVVHAAEPTSKSVSLLALEEAFLRAAVAAAGWTRGPAARPGGGRGTARALARPARVVGRLQAAALAVAMGRDTRLARVKLRLVGDKDSLTVCVEPVQAVPPTPIVEAEPEMVEDEDDGDLADLGLDAFAARRTTGDCGRPRARRGRRRSLPSCPCRSRPRRRRRVAPPCRRPGSSRMFMEARARGRAQRIDFEEVRLRTRPLPEPQGRTRTTVFSARASTAHQRKTR